MDLQVYWDGVIIDLTNKLINSGKMSNADDDDVLFALRPMSAVSATTLITLDADADATKHKHKLDA